MVSKVMTETRYCSGCGVDKPLQQFQVTKENKDGTTWVKTRKWCLACCKALFERQATANKRFRHFAKMRVTDEGEGTSSDY